jgi:hypothetical protein
MIHVVHENLTSVPRISDDSDTRWVVQWIPASMMATPVCAALTLLGATSNRQSHLLQVGLVMPQIGHHFGGHFGQIVVATQAHRFGGKWLAHEGFGF